MLTRGMKSFSRQALRPTYFILPAMIVPGANRTWQCCNLVSMHYWIYWRVADGEKFNQQSTRIQICLQRSYSYAFYHSTIRRQRLVDLPHRIGCILLKIIQTLG